MTLHSRIATLWLLSAIRCQQQSQLVNIVKEMKTVHLPKANAKCCKTRVSARVLQATVEVSQK